MNLNACVFLCPFVCVQLSVDTDLVDFGTQVIGETLKKTIVLTNKGAKGTNFEFIKTTGMDATNKMSESF